MMVERSCGRVVAKVNATANLPWKTQGVRWAATVGSFLNGPPNKRCCDTGDGDEGI